jgi:DNA polymerase (family 10)
MTERLIRAIENPFVDIIGHPTGRLLNVREGYTADWQKIFEACVKEEVALEINSFTDRLDLNDSLVFEAKKFGVKFAISTDAHHIGHMDNMIYGVSVARRGWCEKENILNSRSSKELENFLSIS